MLIANVINIGADIGAMAAAIYILAGCSVLAGSTAYAIGEVYRWPVGLEKKPRRTPLPYMTISALLGLPLLSYVSRGGSIRAAHEQPVGTAYQEMGVFERFENEPARMPFQAR